LRVYNLHVAQPRYVHNAGAVFSLKYHLVWCPKYRRPVLVGPVAERLKALLVEKAAELGATLHAMEVMPDHVQLFVESDPTRAPAHIAAQFKGYTSRVLRREFGSLRSRLPTLWSRSYFAATVGHVSEATVRRYIDTQGERA
jgi:putative transposase